MKKLLIFLSLFLSSAASAGSVDCLIVKEQENYLIKEGEKCGVRFSPASTFKIPLALIGYESAILKDENYPIWQSPQSVNDLKDYWVGEKSPAMWMKYSIVWYSQALTTKLGAANFQKYIDKINYGNRDLSGNPNMNDGLTNSWLSSSLQISSSEQLNFIEKLAKNQLPFSEKSQIKTKNLIKLFEESLLSNGWNLYGKTGTDIDKSTQERRGYFVGFATKNNRLISFVIHVSGEKNSKIGGIYAKKIAVEKMMQNIIN